MGIAFTLEAVYTRHKKSYEGRPAWMWEDEGKYYAVADYHSSAGEFSDADLAFAKKEGLEAEVAAVLEDAEQEERNQHGKDREEGE